LRDVKRGDHPIKRVPRLFPILSGKILKPIRKSLIEVEYERLVSAYRWFESTIRRECNCRVVTGQCEPFVM